MISGLDGSAPRAETAVAAARMRVALTRLYRQLRAHSAVELSPSQLSALTQLEQCGPMRLGALADAEGTSPSTASRLVDVLAERGLVARTADPADRRASLIELCRPGLALLEEVRGRGTAALCRALADLPHAQRGAVEDALPALESLIEVMRHPGAAAVRDNA